MKFISARQNGGNARSDCVLSLLRRDAPYLQIYPIYSDSITINMYPVKIIVCNEQSNYDEFCNNLNFLHHFNVVFGAQSLC